jgi:glycosyltransferase involved in cell wall biosynthesis
MLIYVHNILDARIFHKEALSLKSNGCEVTILAPLFKAKLKDHDTQFNLDENDEVTIQGIRIKAMRLKKTGIPIIGFLIDIFAYRKKLLNIALELKADVYHCHEHKIPLYGLLSLIKRLKKIGASAKYVFDVHEYYPGYIEDKYRGHLSYLFFKSWMKWLDKKAVELIDQFIVVSEASRIYYLSLNKNINIDLITNVSSKKIFNFDPKNTKKLDRFTICHEGNLRFDRGLKDIIEIVKSMKTKNRSLYLKIIGDIPEEENSWLNEQIKNYDLHDDIIITGWIEYPKVGSEIQECHVGLVTMKPLYNNIFSISNKFFNYLLYGLPVIAIKTPAMSRIIEEYQCGLTYAFDDFNELYQYINKLYSDKILFQNLSRNAMACTANYFNWEMAEQKLFHIYQNLREN